MGGHAHGYRVQVRSDRVGHSILPGEDDRQRAGPEGIHQADGGIVYLADRVKLAAVVDVDDQRIIRRAALGAEDAQHRLRVHGVRAQAVHRFGGEGDQLALGQQAGCQGQGFVRRGKKLGFHIFHPYVRLRSLAACSSALSASMISSRSPSMMSWMA